MDETDFKELLLKAYLMGISDGVDLVFSTLKDAGWETFDLKYSERYSEMVKRSLDIIAVRDKMTRMIRTEPS